MGSYPIIALVIFFLRIIEWYNFDDGNRSSIAHQHYLNTQTDLELNCLILGGSNSVYSLSAEQMSRNERLNCYNLSLINEGFSSRTYWNFIKSLSLDRNKMNYIFYSSMVSELDEEYYFQKLLNDRQNISLSGKKPFSFNGKSFASYAFEFISKGEFSKTIQYPLPTKYGDFDFSKFSCKFIYSEEKRNWQDMSILKTWVSSQLNQMKILFPNAQIFFLKPSLLRGDMFDKKANIKVTQSLESLIIDIDGSQNKINFIVEPHFYDTKYMCDSNHHTNPIGREIRTKNLLNSFESISTELKIN